MSLTQKAMSMTVVTKINLENLHYNLERRM